MSGAAPSDRAATAIALLAAAAVTCPVGLPTLSSYDFGIRGFDSLWYHLPWAPSFAQTGQITPLRFTDVEYLTAFYPATAEMLHGLGNRAARPRHALARDQPRVARADAAGRVVHRAPARVRARDTARRCARARHPGDRRTRRPAAPRTTSSGCSSCSRRSRWCRRPRTSPRRSYSPRSPPVSLSATKLSLLAPVLALTIGTLAIQPAGRRLLGAGAGGSRCCSPAASGTRAICSRSATRCRGRASGSCPPHSRRCSSTPASRSPTT